MENNTIQTGLRANWRQFTLLVIVNAFVGGMIGMERSIFPEYAQRIFGIGSNTAILSFITAFGLTKAITNYFTGKLANHYGRKNLLLAGWVLALPIPVLLMHAPNWNWVVWTNILLGISQALTWSSTVVMKIDLAGEKDRGLAMGLNEFAGYFAVGIVAFLSGWVAHQYGITPYPFYIGLFIAVCGLLLTWIWVKDTQVHVRQAQTKSVVLPLDNVFIETSFKNKTLSAVTQAGMVNNLNDGMIWGLLPVLLLSRQYDSHQIGVITAIYPTVWGITQLFTGKMSDKYSKKAMIFWGMLMQGLAILSIPVSSGMVSLVVIATGLGLGTALVYPTFLSTIAQATAPIQRAESIGTFRLWRDLGYAFGAIISGITADMFGVEYAILLIGGITVLSAAVLQIRMPGAIPSTKTCIEPEEVQQALQHRGNIRIIDVRSKEEYEHFHIPNAIHISLAELKNNIYDLSKNEQLVTVCTKGGGHSAHGAAIIRGLGFKASWLCGGICKWQQIYG